MEDQKNIIIAIDQGTTGTRVIAYHYKIKDIIYTNYREHKQYYPQKLYVEHDLNEILENLTTLISEMFDQKLFKREDILGIGITNQRETLCLYDKDTGEPLAPAIVWQDKRTQDWCHDKKSSFDKKLSKVCGLPLDPYFTGSKLSWAINNNQKVKTAYEDEKLYASTIESFLLFHLTDYCSYFTDHSNASRTLLMNIESLQWSEELLDFFDVKKSILPEIRSSFYNFGVCGKKIHNQLSGVPILFMMGDQQSSLLGLGGVNIGDMKVTMGTGAFALMNVGENYKISDNGLISTFFYQDPDSPSKKFYAYEGQTYIVGSALQWLRDELHFISDFKEIDERIKNLETDLEPIQKLQLV